jgi:hypothetical protein
MVSEEEEEEDEAVVFASPKTTTLAVKLEAMKQEKEERREEVDDGARHVYIYKNQMMIYICRQDSVRRRGTTTLSPHMEQELKHFFHCPSR